jgi:hypothetical protein
MGLDVSLFGYSVQDYMLRSVRSLSFVLVSTMMVAIVWVEADRWVRKRLESRNNQTVIGRVALIVTAVSIVVTATAWLLAIVRPEWSVLFVPYIMALGVLIGAWAVSIRRQARRSPASQPSTAHVVVEKSLVFALVTPLLFWGTADFAQMAGRGQALEIERNINSMPRADVYSPQRMALTAQNVTEQQAGTAGSPIYHYRGLRLLVLSGHRFFLLHDGWTLANGTVTVIPDDNNVRLDFSND